MRQNGNIKDEIEVMEEGMPFFLKGEGKMGCLLIHGFTGTTSSMRPMGEYLNTKGMTVICPRLPGHGTNIKDMARWSYSDWVKAVENALDDLLETCEICFVSGLSMGGLLTLYLAEKRGSDIAGIVPICAPVYKLTSGIARFALPLVPVLSRVIKSLPGPAGDIKDPNAKEVAYSKFSTHALGELIKLMKLVEAELPLVNIPIRIYESKEDHVVPPENATYIYENVSSADKELVWLENSYHVATLDYDKQKIFEESFEFFSRVEKLRR